MKENQNKAQLFHHFMYIPFQVTIITDVHVMNEPHVHNLWFTAFFSVRTQSKGICVKVLETY